MAEQIYDEYYRRYACCCVYCGLNGGADIRIWFNLQIDHLVPNPLEHRESSLNIVVACKGCNGLKGQFDPSDAQKIPATEEEKERPINEAKKYILSKHERDRAWHESHLRPLNSN